MSVCLSVCLSSNNVKKRLPWETSNTVQQRLHLETPRMNTSCLHCLFLLMWFAPQIFSAAALVWFSHKPTRKAPLPPPSYLDVTVDYFNSWTRRDDVTVFRGERQSRFRLRLSEQNYVSTTTPSAYCDVRSTSSVTSQCGSRKREPYSLLECRVGGGLQF